MPAAIAPVPFPPWLTNNGVLANGYQIFTYLAGTTTKAATYTSSDMGAAHTNPIIVDSSGRTPSPIWLAPGVSMKFVFTTDTDSDPPVSPIWTADNINSTEATDLDVDITGEAGETIAGIRAVYLSDGSGGRLAGRWYKTDTTNTYSSTEPGQLGVTQAAIASGETGTIRIVGRTTFSFTSLTAGAVHYLHSLPGGLTTSPPANARALGVGDSTGGTTKLVLSPWVRGTTVYPNNWAFTSASTLTVAGPATFTSPPVGAAKIARCTSALTKNNNTTVADITGLAFAVAASETWAFTFYLKGITTTTANWKFAITGPTTPTAVWYGHAKPSNIGIAATATLGTAILREGVTASPGTEEMIQISGYIRNSTNAGTIQLQMAQSTGEVFDTIIRAESYVVAVREA